MDMVLLGDVIQVDRDMSVQRVTQHVGVSKADETRGRG